MNLQDLITKLQKIEEGALPVAPVSTDSGGAGASDEGIEIIGSPMPSSIMGHSEPPKQQDSINMNVSLNGSGAQGVKDLMNILRDIENGVTHDEPVHGEPSPAEPAHDTDTENDTLLGDMIHSIQHDAPEEEVEEEQGETWGNSVHGDQGAHTKGIGAVTNSGDDMNSKGKLSPLARAPGSNTMVHHYHESLVSKLKTMYEAIKEDRTEEKDKDGNVIRWKEEGEWTKKSGKEGRGKVTNLSDKARRETEKLSKKEPEKMHESVSQMLALNKRLNG